MTEQEWQACYEITSIKGKLWKRADLRSRAVKMASAYLGDKQPRLLVRAAVQLVLDDPTFMRSRTGMVPARVIEDAGFHKGNSAVKMERGSCNVCGQRSATRDGEAADGRPQYRCLNGRCEQTWTRGYAGEAWDTRPAFEAWLDATYPGQEVEVWIGFDAAETERVEKDPNIGKERGAVHLGKLPLWWRWTRALAYAMTHARRVNRFPLIERGLCRCRCEALARASGYPIPRKSSCQYCPYASRGDWQRFAVERPERFAKVVEMEDRKPLTVKNGRKLSIMAYSSKTQTGTPLPVFVRRPYTAKIMPCRVCGATNRATKASGCGYLAEGAEVAA